MIEDCLVTNYYKKHSKKNDVWRPNRSICTVKSAKYDLESLSMEARRGEVDTDETSIWYEEGGRTVEDDSPDLTIFVKKRINYKFTRIRVVYLS